jgi:branched-subunit amino acid ABC-type transport system permease component
VALYLFAERTYLGKAVRAVWQNPTGAALAGIDLGRVTRITYGLALATAGVGGVALALVGRRRAVPAGAGRDPGEVSHEELRPERAE